VHDKLASAVHALCAALVACGCPCFGGVGALPAEPVTVGTTPQFLVDDYIVDNRFAIKYKNHAVTRRFHQPKKHESNPLFAEDGSYANVVRDEQTGLFRMWYQVFDRTEKLAGGSTRYAVAYAESKDGLQWERPELGLFQWKGSKRNNIVWRGPKQARASGMQILLSIPEEQKRGYRYVMSYRVGGAGRELDGIRLIGSHDGIHWGFLWAFRMNDPIYTQLATSRDGIHWERLPRRPALIPLGDEGAWDGGMVFGGPHWVEVGDQWWFYYMGFDEGHQSKTRTAGLGLATLRKEGLISLHGPANGGGVVITRKILWPGGDLVLNVEAPDGEVRVRVSDRMRQVLPGFDYDDCRTFAGDSVAHTVRWQDREIDSLKGQVIRLEIFLQNADLYTFRATGSE